MRIHSSILGIKTGTSLPPAGQSVKNTAQPKPNVSVTQPIQDSVHFQGHTKPAADKIETEKKRLLASIPLVYLFDERNTLPARAEYNATHDRNALNGFTPYRQQYVLNQDQDSLRKYDQQVDKIMEQAEFYHTDHWDGFCNALNALYNKVELAPYPDTSNSYRAAYYTCKEKAQRGRKIPESEVQSLLRDKMHPLHDDSNRYISVSGIVELLHRKPDYIDHALKQNSKHPLRIMTSHTKKDSGRHYTGLNLLMFSKPFLWRDTEIDGSAVTPQHEFMHLLSEDSDRDTLPFMSESQKSRYHRILDQIVNDYMEKDYLVTRHWAPNQETTSGLRQYAFSNTQELLAESIDTFKIAPEKLRQTAPGRELYDLYKELFDIDPLNDLPKKKKH